MTAFYQRIRSFCPLLRSRYLCIALLLATSVAGGCRARPKSVPINQNFDALTGWFSPEPAWLTSTKAHSGKYACLMDAKDEYLTLFKTKFADIDEPRRVRLRSWAWLPRSGLKISLVLVVSRGDSVLAWEQLPIGQVTRRYQQWEPAVRDIDLPHTLAPDDKVQLYLWQSSDTRENLYVDDIVLEKIR